MWINEQQYLEREFQWQDGFGIAARRLHDPALWVGEVVLRLVLRYTEVAFETTSAARTLAIIVLRAPLTEIMALETDAADN